MFDTLLDEFDDDTPRAPEDDIERFQKLPIDDDDSSGFLACTTHAPVHDLRRGRFDTLAVDRNVDLASQNL